MPEPVGFRRVDLARQPRYDVPSYGSTHHRHPKRGFVRVPHTLSEISAPCMAPTWYAPHEDLPKVDGKAALGERIIVAGRVLVEDGRPPCGAMVGDWQANAAGRKPDPLPGPGNQTQAPHVTISLFARGLLKQLVTRGEALNATDPVRQSTDPARRRTLIARQAARGEWRLDLRLRGEGETVFLEV